MRLSKKILTTVLLALSVSCGSSLFVEVEIPRLCTTSQDVDFQGVSAGVALDKSVDIPLDEQIPLNGVDGAETELRIEELSLIAKTDDVNLSGVETVLVSVSIPDKDPKEVLKYNRNPQKPESKVLVASGDSVDIASYITAKQLTVRIVASGSPPASNWKGDVKVCVSGKNRIPYAK